MLPIKRRLKKESFTKVMKEGVFKHSDNFYIRFLSFKDQKCSQFAFVVPNKVKKTSVGRHLIKRKMTAGIEKVLIDIKPCLAIIVFAKKDISHLLYSKIEIEIVNLLIKNKLLNDVRF